MNSTKLQMVFLVAALAAFVFALGAALNGCATLDFKEYHGTITVDGPTRIVTGPIRGHWMEEDNAKGVILYVIASRDCEAPIPRLEKPTIASSGSFRLEDGVSLCMLPLVQGRNQYITLHARRP